MTLWSVEAFFVIPLGAICLLLLLSDFRPLQKISMGICSIQVALGSISVSVSSIFALFSTVVFAYQSLTTLNNTKPTITPQQTIEMADRIRMKEWRNDRNWWISLFACTLWLICWRVQIWTKRYCLIADAAEQATVDLRPPSPPSPSSPKDKLSKKKD